MGRNISSQTLTGFVEERKPRTCLRCGKLFDSRGPGNRICSKHANRALEPYVSPHESMSEHGGSPRGHRIIRKSPGPT